MVLVGRPMKDEPSVARWASLLVGALAAAYGALVELREVDYRSAEAVRLTDTYETAVKMCATLYGKLGERREELLADEEMEPVLEAIGLMASECARLSGEAAERLEIDAQFQAIADRLQEGGLG